MAIAWVSESLENMVIAQVSEPLQNIGRKREATREKDGDRNGKVSEELQRADPGH